MTDGKVIALTATTERKAATWSGYVMLVVLLLAILADIYGIQRLGHGRDGVGLTTVFVATIAFILVMPGFYMLQPNQAAAITLFGEYRGADRATGLRWTWPWLPKKKRSGPREKFISQKKKGKDLCGH